MTMNPGEVITSDPVSFDLAPGEDLAITISFLAERLQGNPETQEIGILSQGIGGNSVLRACLGLEPLIGLTATS